MVTQCVCIVWKLPTWKKESSRMVDTGNKLPTLGLLCLDTQPCSMGTDAFSDNKLWTLYTWGLQMAKKLNVKGVA